MSTEARDALWLAIRSYRNDFDPPSAYVEDAIDAYGAEEAARGAAEQEKELREGDIAVISFNDGVERGREQGAAAVRAQVKAAIEEFDYPHHPLCNCIVATVRAALAVDGDQTTEGGA